MKRAYHILANDNDTDTCVVSTSRKNAIKSIESTQWWKEHKLKVKRIVCKGQVQESK